MYKNTRVFVCFIPKNLIIEKKFDQHSFHPNLKLVMFKMKYFFYSTELHLTRFETIRKSSERRDEKKEEKKFLNS